MQNGERKVESKLQKYKQFHETFVYCSFGLAFGLMYPNKAILNIRWLLFFGVVIINLVMLIWFAIYTVECLINLDLFNSARNITLGTLISLFIVKFIYIMTKTTNFELLLRNISTDLLKANDMDECCQEIYDEFITKAKRAEVCWIIIPLLMVAQFSLYAAICNIYKSITGDEGPRAMVHDMQLKTIEHFQYETPYFEMIFAYNTTQCFIIALSFIAIDGSFCIVTTHLSLKLKLLAHKMSKIFKMSKSRDELEINLKNAIKEHQEAIAFYNLVQEVYGGWLFMVFLVTSMLIALNVYILNMIRQFHPKYVVFFISAIIQMLAPCYFSSELTEISEELSTAFYCTGWEIWGDIAITKLLIFMITKAQDTMVLSGKGMVYFNMQLFTSVMQSAYSFFTLISSNQ